MGRFRLLLEVCGWLGAHTDPHFMAGTKRWASLARANSNILWLCHPWPGSTWLGRAKVTGRRAGVTGRLAAGLCLRGTETHESLPVWGRNLLCKRHKIQSIKDHTWKKFYNTNRGDNMVIMIKNSKKIKIIMIMVIIRLMIIMYII